MLNPDNLKKGSKVIVSMSGEIKVPMNKKEIEAKKQKMLAQKRNKQKKMA